MGVPGIISSATHSVVAGPVAAAHDESQLRHLGAGHCRNLNTRQNISSNLLITCKSPRRGVGSSRPPFSNFSGLCCFLSTITQYPCRCCCSYAPQIIYTPSPQAATAATPNQSNTGPVQLRPFRGITESTSLKTVP